MFGHLYTSSEGNIKTSFRSCKIFITRRPNRGGERPDSLLNEEDTYGEKSVSVQSQNVFHDLQIILKKKKINLDLCLNKIVLAIFCFCIFDKPYLACPCVLSSSVEQRENKSKIIVRCWSRPSLTF